MAIVTQVQEKWWRASLMEMCWVGGIGEEDIAEGTFILGLCKKGE